MAYLILLRHGESLWNAKGLWTGLSDIGLSEKGRQEAKKAGLALANVPINIAFVSKLKRARQTLFEIQKVLELPNIQICESPALNERDYGDYTGKNKWEIQKEVGEEKFKKIRRGWDYPIPNGETLKDVYNRVVPYYKSEILPRLLENKNTLVSAHGNSLRALVKYLENIPDEKIPYLEIATGEIYVYEIDQKDNIVKKQIIPAQT